MYPDLAFFVLRVVIGGVVMQHGLLKLGIVGKAGSINGVASLRQVVACSRSSASVVPSDPDSCSAI